MVKRAAKVRGEEVESPDLSVEVPDPRPRSYEPSHVVQSLIEIQRQVASVSEKVDRVCRDVENLSKDVNDQQSTLTWVKGFAACAMVLIPICGLIIWWLIGGKINEIRDQLINRQTASIEIPYSER